MKKKVFWLPYLVALAALAAGTFCDYTLTDTLYQQVPWLGILFEKVMLFPLEMLVAFSLCVCARGYQRPLLLLGALAMSIYAAAEWKNSWLTADDLLTWLGVLLVATLLWFGMWQLSHMIEEAFIKQHRHWFAFYVCVFLSAVALTTLIKCCWGRIRYRQLDSALQFVPWYELHPFSGYVSFPSGHTTAFTTILCFLDWKRNPHQPLAKGKAIIIWSAILLMPLARMIMGAHYLSDTAVGFMITYTMYLIYRHWFLRSGYL